MLFKFVFISLISLFYFDATAENIEAIYIKGKVFVENPKGQVSKLTAKMEVSELSKISTGSDGFAILKINNHSTHKIEENTEIVVKELPYFYKDSTSLEQGSVIELIRGVILSEIKNKSGIETFKIISGSTSFGVRGTRFLISKDEENNLLASVDEGQVEVIGSKSGQQDFLEKNESIEVLKGKTFQKRQKFSFSKNINWNVSSRDSKKSFRNIQKTVKQELKKRRQVWVKDSQRINKFKNKWQERKIKWKEKTRSLRSSSKLKIRNNFIEKNKNSTLKDRFKNRRSDIRSSVKDKKSKVRKAIQTRRKKRQK